MGREKRRKGDRVMRRVGDEVSGPEIGLQKE